MATHYLAINSGTLLAKSYLKKRQTESSSVWQLRFGEAPLGVNELTTQRLIHFCDPTDDWALNAELMRAFDTVGRFDEIIIFPGELKFGPIEAIPSAVIQGQIARQLSAMIELYRALAGHLKHQKSSLVTQVVYRTSDDFAALSALPMAINSAMTGLVLGLKSEFKAFGAQLQLDAVAPVENDFIDTNYSFFNDLGLDHYQALVNRHLKSTDRMFKQRARRARTLSSTNVISLV